MDELKIGDAVTVDLTGLRFVRCPECGYGWMIAGHNITTCPECGGNGIIGRLVTREDLDGSHNTSS